MKKHLFIYSSVVLLFGLLSCNKNEVLEQTESSFQVSYKKKGEAISKLSQLQESNYGTLVALGDHVLEKEGEWAYKEAYLFETPEETHEVYVFDAEDPAYVQAKAECTMHYERTGNKITCSGNGSTCSISYVDCDVCIKTCLTDE